MKISVLIAQRMQNYPGQYGIEALRCASEYELGDNPLCLLEDKSDYDKSGEFESTAIIQIEVDENQLKSILDPSLVPVQATLITQQPN